MVRNLPDITELSELRGTRILVRASLNVPIEDGVVRNQFRLRHALPTIQHLADSGARVVVVGHIGREKNETLYPVYEALWEYVPVSWCDTTIGEKAARAVAELADGHVLLLENLRSYDGETANDDTFAQSLATLGDIYINDAFSVSHREHASIIGVPRYLPAYIGYQFKKEYEELSSALNPLPRSIFILGGAKFATKEPLIRKFLDLYDTVFIGGALANEFFKARGMEVGRSVIEDGHVANDVLHHPNLVLPETVIAEDENGVAAEKSVNDILPDEKIVDVMVPKTLLGHAQTILWNGPLGYYEGGYDAGTIALARAIAASDTRAIVGGGDTIAAIESLGLDESFGFLSTAGGAMLAFLEKGTLPGIDAIS